MASPFITKSTNSNHILPQVYLNKSITSGQSRDWFRGDKALWIVFFLLTAISLVAVYSSIGRSAIEDDGTTPIRAFLKHFLFVVFTYGIVIGVSRLDYRIFSRLSQILLWISVGLLVFVLATHGQRWIVIPKVGQFQPSELAKVSLIIYVARLLAFREESAGTLETFMRVLLPVGVVSLLVFKENFSTAALIFLSCYFTMLFGGVNKKYWWRLFLVLVAAVCIALFVWATSDTAPEVGRSDTWGARVARWWDNDHSRLTQENMARMAIARGKVIGVGIGNTVFARLMTQANNDFIYAIIIEETGMVGGIAILLLYSIFFFRCIKVAFRCSKPFGMLTAVGMGTVIYLQALVNMSVAVGVLPVTGQTLPFISSGGTAYLALGLGVGVVQAVAADAQRNKTIQETSREETTQ
ncbi:MAG: cell division protein FtsW [bacterium P3]|nr:MAG: cell division protein FtsW [bacterium P3]KWW40509.1 MAG: cell division protein FtsW [bacterium F083]